MIFRIRLAGITGCSPEISCSAQCVNKLSSDRCSRGDSQLQSISCEENQQLPSRICLWLAIQTRIQRLSKSNMLPKNADETRSNDGHHLRFRKSTILESNHANFGGRE